MADKARTPITIGLSAAVGAIVASGVLTIAGQDPIDVDVYKATSAALPIEVAGGAKTKLAAQLEESGAQGAVTCKRGAVSNEPDKVYCTDGLTAGFLLDAATDSALLGEVASKAGELASDDIEIQAADGKIYAKAASVVAAAEQAKEAPAEKP